MLSPLGFTDLLLIRFVNVCHPINLLACFVLLIFFLVTNMLFSSFFECSALLLPVSALVVVRHGAALAAPAVVAVTLGVQTGAVGAPPSRCVQAVV